MKLLCDVYIEPYFPSLKSAYTPTPSAQLQRPIVCQGTAVSVDRDSSRDVSLFVGRMDGDNAVVTCRVEDIVDVDSSKLQEGCLALRTSSPHVQLQIYNTRVLLLEDFFRLLKKLTDRRSVGSTVRFRSNPDAVLALQKKEKRSGILSRSGFGFTDSSLPSAFSTHENGSQEGSVRSRPLSRQDYSEEPHPRPYPPATQHVVDESFKVNLESEIEGLRLAMEGDAKERQQLEEAIQRLERENAYLNAQLKMELKSKVDLKQAAAEARGRAEGAEGRLREKQSELQVRTDELIEARSGHETRIEQELRRLAEVEAYTGKAQRRLEKMQGKAAELFGAKAQHGALGRAMGAWMEVLGGAVGSRRRREEAVRRFYRALLKRPFGEWRRRVEKVLRLGGGLPQLGLRQRRRVLDGTMRWWRGAATEGWRERVGGELERLSGLVEEGRGRVMRAEEEAKTARELVAVAQGKARRGEEEREEEVERVRSEAGKAREEAAQLKERLGEERDKAETAMREARAGRERERVALDRVEEERVRHVREEKGLKERLKDAEATAERLRAELGMAKAAQRELEDLVGRREGAVSERTRRVEELEGAVRTLEEERVRLARQLGEEEEAREEAEQRRREVQGRLEELERSMEVAEEREEGRRAEVEMALQKLVRAFKEAKLRHRREVQAVSRASQLLTHFLSWRRAAEQEALAERERERERVLELQREVVVKEEEMEQLAEEVRDLEAAVREGREREADLRKGRQSAEEQLAALKETYLRGVKASVHSIRMCRDKYLPPTAAPDGGTH